MGPGRGPETGGSSEAEKKSKVQRISEGEKRPGETGSLQNFLSRVGRFWMQLILGHPQASEVHRHDIEKRLEIDSLGGVGGEAGCVGEVGCS